MQSLPWVIGIAGVISILLAAVYLSWRDEKAFQALVADNEAFDQYMKWIFSHPGMPIGRYKNGQKLLLARINARKKFLERNPWYKEDGTIQYLRSKLNEQ
jgi:hypothetical protein